ncbi:MerR family transcriptional regulator [Desertimonas flava]|uniref:MerR family transcriptional regulator n=1 Tax=Desertimonas flava TaxID=2064846 RepID=UPI000E34D30F|nr:MerR family transcriptional regulator [Desertimonas flava]
MFTIGEFSRATHLSVKALRHYDEIGLLVPAEVDPSSGYRHYQAAQVPAAHLVKRLRDLEMPLPQIREVLAAPDADARDRVIAHHLERMESALVKTLDTVAALRSLLTRDPDAAIGHRTVPAIPVAVERAVVSWDEAEDWLATAFERLHARADATGPDGAVYEPTFFEQHAGEVTAFVPVASSSDSLGAASYAVAVHHGAFDRLDETYGVLGSYVTTRGIGARGAIREHYLDDSTTEVLWPIR